MRMPLPMAVVGIGRQLLEVNEAFAQLLGYTEREALLLTVSDIVRREDLAKDEELTQQLLAGEVPYFELETGYARSDGEVVWVRVTAVAYHREGHPPSSLRVVRNVRGSRGITKEEAQADNFRLLFDSLMEGALVHDDGTILLANQSLREMFAYSSDELSRLSPSDFFTPDSRALVLRHFEGGNNFPLDAAGLRKDGTTIPIRMRVRGMVFDGRRMRLTIIQSRLVAQSVGPKTANAASFEKPLSPREAEVFGLLVRGIDNLEISKELEISRRTVEHHVSHILTKLGTANRTAAVLVAHQTGILTELGY